jgi:transcriptional regulator with XRE-family HTH domain
MLGAFVRAERRRGGWSQAELARRCGCAPFAHARLERGQCRYVGRRALTRLAAALGLPVRQLEELAGPALWREPGPGR